MSDNEAMYCFHFKNHDKSFDYYDLFHSDSIALDVARRKMIFFGYTCVWVYRMTSPDTCDTKEYVGGFDNINKVFV